MAVSKPLRDIAARLTAHADQKAHELRDRRFTMLIDAQAKEEICRAELDAATARWRGSVKDVEQARAAYLASCTLPSQRGAI